MRKMRKQGTGHLTPGNFDLEEGDRVVDYEGAVYDLRESKGGGKELPEN